MTQSVARPVVLVTGVGRTVGIGAGIARQLAASGWDIAFTWSCSSKWRKTGATGKDCSTISAFANESLAADLRECTRIQKRQVKLNNLG